MDGNEEDLRRNSEAYSKNTAALNKLAEALGVKGNSTRGSTAANRSANPAGMKFDFKAAQSAFNRQTETLTRSLKTLGGGADSLMAGFDSLLRKVYGGAIVAEVISAGKALSDQYKKLTDIGQTFGGSMFEMAAQAGEAGLPLGKFAAMLERNSTASAVLASQSSATGTTMGQLQKAVRDGARDFGFYGMSLDDITGLTSDYTETLRLQGRAAAINKEQTSKDINAFAKDITDFAAVTGKSRQQIAKAAMGAMQDVAYLAKDFTAAQQESGRKAITFMASMPGQAGDMLSKMLSQTIAYGGAIFSDDMHTFAEAGQGAFLNIIDTIANKVNRGGGFDEQDEAENLQAMQNYYKQNKENLLRQAQAGNQQAKQVLGMLQQLNSLNAKDYIEKRRAQEQFKEFTNFFAKIEEALSVLAGHFLEGMMKPLQALDSTGAKFPDLIKMFSAQFEFAGEKIGQFIADFMQPESIRVMADTVKSLLAFGNGLLTVGGWFIKGVSLAVNAFTSLSNLFHKAGDTVGSFLTGLTTLGLLFGPKLFSLFKGLWQRDVQIHARSASIITGALGGGHGGSRGGGGLGGGPAPAHPGGGKASGRLKGLLGGLAGMIGGGDCCDGLLGGIGNLTDRLDFHGERAHANARGGVKAAEEAATGAVAKATPHLGADAAKAAPLGAAVVEDAAKTTETLAFRAGRGTAEVASKAAGSVVKTAAKAAGAIAKFVPGLGLVMGTVFAAQRAMEGDFIGAAGEVLGGIASTLPGFGTAADVAIQAFLAVRDGVGHKATDHAIGNAVYGSIWGNQPSTATPNDQDNPYLGKSETGLRADYDDVTKHLVAAQAAADQQSDIIKQLGIGNEINANIAKLTTEKNQLDAAAHKKNIDLQKKTVTNGDILIQQTN